MEIEHDSSFTLSMDCLHFSSQIPLTQSSLAKNQSFPFLKGQFSSILYLKPTLLVYLGCFLEISPLGHRPEGDTCFGDICFFEGDILFGDFSSIKFHHRSFDSNGRKINCSFTKTL